MTRSMKKFSRRPRGSTRLIAAGSLAVGLLLVAICLYVFWPGTSVAAPDVGQPVAEAFLASIRGGQVDAAWESTSAEFKSDEGRDSFRVFVQKNPAVAGPLEFEAYEDVSLNGVKRAQFLFQPTASPLPLKVRVVVGRDGDAWKVDGVFVE